MSDPPTTPDPRDIQEDFSRMLKEKYGNSVQVRVMPQFGARQIEGDTSDDDDSTIEIEFDLKPADIAAHLDRFVIGQQDAKKVLATAVCDHYNHIRNCAGGRECSYYQKQNVILIGSTGIGKTYLVRTISELIQVPFVRADATKFSETGYVGGDVEELVRDLVHRAGDNVKLAEYGIIYLDEVDKIGAPGGVMGRDVSGRGVQMGLLKLMEETEVPLRAPNDMTGQLQAMMEFQAKGKAERKTVNTKHILFIVSGAFTGLTDIVRRRVSDRAIGFGRAQSWDAEEEHELFNLAKSADFVEFGFEPEFIGRLPVSVACHPLKVQHLYEILKNSEGSLVRQYVESFRAYGIELIFADTGLQRIAERAHEEETGARGLASVLERTLRDFKFALPSSTVKQFVVTAEVVDAPAAELARVLEGGEHTERLVRIEQLHAFENDFERRHDIRIRFHDAATEAIIAKSLELGVEPREVCEPLLHGYEHGLNLIRANTGQRTFEITREVLDRPTETLNRWIKAACGGGD